MTQSELKKYREFQFVQMFADKTRPTQSQIARKLDMSPKMVYKLVQRIRKNGSLVPRKRGRQRKVTAEMIDFLEQWFNIGGNVGKTFE